MNSALFAQGMHFTPEDRDRLIRLEVRLEEAVKTLQRQIDDLKTFLLLGFGILFGGMGILIGFVLWDRRTAIAPVVTKS